MGTFTLLEGGSVHGTCNIFEGEVLSGSVYGYSLIFVGKCF